MTVSDIDPVVTYSYSGPGNYTFSFGIVNDDDLILTYTDTNGVSSTLVLGTDYTVSTVVGVTGGTCVLLTPTTTSGLLEIRRGLKNTQEVDWVNNNPLDMSIVEAAFDKDVMLIQQLKSIVDDATIVTNWRGDWVTGAAYNRRDMIISTSNNNLYICLTAHTSGTFNTDLANGLWSLIFDAASLSTVPVAGYIANEAALGTGSQDGEFKICLSNGNFYTWDLANTKWRIRSGNIYTSDPLATTYTIETGTFIRVGNSIKRYTGSAWVNITPAKVLSKRNLKVYTTSATNVTIKADEIYLRNLTTNEDIYFSGVNVGCSIAMSGVDGLDTGSETASTRYFLWLISNGVTLSALISLSDTSPVMPSGYVNARLVGEVYNDSSSNFVPFYRVNDFVYFEDPLAVYTNQTLTTTPVQFSLPNAVPSDVMELLFEASNTTTNSVSQILMPDSTVRLETVLSHPPSTGVNAGPTGGYASVVQKMLHLGASSIYARSNESASRTGQNLHIWGYKLEV
jgi:hypothetical protein